MPKSKGFAHILLLFLLIPIALSILLAFYQLKFVSQPNKPYYSNKVAGATRVELFPVGDSFTVLTSRDANHGRDQKLLLTKEGFDPRSGSWVDDIYMIFDLSGLPKMAKINKATLKMYMFDAKQSHSSTVDIIALKGSWSERNLTARIRPRYWTSTEDDPQYVVTPQEGFKQWDITRLVQDWVDGVYNFGFILKTSESTQYWMSTFYSKEIPNQYYKPKLIIDYESPDLSPLAISDVKGEFINPTTAKFTWTTNRSSKSQVEISTTSDFKNSSKPGVMGYTKNHMVFVENLEAGIIYYYKVKSECNMNEPYYQRCNIGSRIESAVSRFNTLKPFDEPQKAIKVFNVRIANTKSDSVTIKWETDKISNGEVEYGLTTRYGLSKKTAGINTKHQVTLTNLQPSTTYRFRIKVSMLLLKDGLTRNYAFTTAKRIIEEEEKDVSVEEETPQVEEQEAPASEETDLSQTPSPTMEPTLTPIPTETISIENEIGEDEEEPTASKQEIKIVIEDKRAEMEGEDQNKDIREEEVVEKEVAILENKEVVDESSLEVAKAIQGLSQAINKLGQAISLVFQGFLK